MHALHVYYTRAKTPLSVPHVIQKRIALYVHYIVTKNLAVNSAAAEEETVINLSVNETKVQLLLCLGLIMLQFNET